MSKAAEFPWVRREASGEHDSSRGGVGVWLPLDITRRRNFHGQVWNAVEFLWARTGRLTFHVFMSRYITISFRQGFEASSPLTFLQG